MHVYNTSYISFSYFFLIITFYVDTTASFSSRSNISDVITEFRRSLSYQVFDGHFHDLYWKVNLKSVWNHAYYTYGVASDHVGYIGEVFEKPLQKCCCCVIKDHTVLPYEKSIL